jgi:hypothetical protein
LFIYYFEPRGCKGTVGHPAPGAGGHLSADKPVRLAAQNRCLFVFGFGPCACLLPLPLCEPLAVAVVLKTALSCTSEAPCERDLTE